MTNLSPLVRVHEVHFSYGHEQVLHGVSLSVNPGEILAITGANGSGKSTLLELIAGTNVPSHGHIERIVPVALVVQRPNIPAGLPLTVADVVALGTWRTRASRAQVRESITGALSRVGLSGFERRNFAQLSGGQRQRTLIAQGLVQQTPVLLLDEPLAALDAGSREKIHEILRAEANHGTAVVLVTHDQDSQGLADRTITLRDGRIAPHVILSGAIDR
ncbi:metal ABC transporter ATP-binding protein [Glutamicibacter sp. JL.03c]|uniref:metal ABC transporter ATP-binding protein n=1 Tax=Glutamicibacter sp. JL.03c TaxID=2984842 RepID=UPI0021F6FE50|nr:metal ABC transporter ATP-binding protein [Glutamicibacter sp. JL.03c]UYQ77016.1 metal ABC transporter ATP-binding protein [Glutamicibacter sp. JL.03c]